MDQKLLKTSKKQRITISIIAVVMIFSIIASYAAIIANGGKTDVPVNTDAIVAKYEDLLNAKRAEVATASTGYFNEFIEFKNHITAYNETSINNDGNVYYDDLKIGSGRELTDGDTDYLAYYVGWCADESIFDSTFNSTTDPTSFNNLLDASQGLIEGWEVGVIGMKLGGIREITIPGSLAYADSLEICGGYNKPLKFIVMPVENAGEIGTLAKDLSLAQTKYNYAVKFGIDYDKTFGDANVTIEGETE